MKIVKILLIYLLNLNLYEASSLNKLVSMVGNLINEASSNNEKQSYKIQEIADVHKNYEKFNNELNYVNFNESGGDETEKQRGDEMCKKLGRCGCSRSGGCSGRNDLDELVDDINKEILQDLKDDSLKNEIIKNIEQESFRENIHKKCKDVLVVLMNPQEAKAFLQSLRYNQNIPENLLESIISEILDLASVSSNENLKLKRSRIPFSPKEIAKYYNEFKDQVIQRIFNYVKNIPPKKPLPFLTLKPRWEFQSLKEMFKKHKMKDAELRRVILDMLLGDNTNMKIHPHKNRNLYEIVVPKWVYIAFYKMRKYNKHGFE